MKPPARLLHWVGTCLVLLAARPGFALELSVERPGPTQNGAETAFSAEVDGAVGTPLVRWDFGDGDQTEFASPDTPALHTYAGPGHYPVIIVAQDDSGYASQSFVHTVHTAPAAQRARTSSALLLDEVRGLAIAANTDAGTVTLVDTTTFESVVEIPVFDGPTALALAPDGLLWVVHREEYAVAIVDLDEMRTVDFFRLPYASQPVGIVFSPDGHAFIPLLALGDVIRIDAGTKEIALQQHVAPNLRGITVSGDGSALWVTRFLSAGDHGEVYRLDPETLEVVATSALMEDTTTEDSDVQGRGLPNYLFSLTVSPDGTEAWIPSKKDNMARGLERDGLPLTQDSAVRPLISVLDLATDQEVVDLRIDLDDRNLPRDVTFTSLGDYAFISVYGSNLVEVRDAYTKAFVTTIRSDQLLGPVASVLTSDDHLLTLADLGRTLVVFDVGDLVHGVDMTSELIAEVPLVRTEKLSAMVLEGKQLFGNAEDKRMSSEGYLSCASCHFDGFEDGLVWDFFDRGEGFRNTTSLLGRRGMGHGRVHWSANFDEIQDFEGPIRVHQAGLGFMSLEEFQTGTRSDPLGDPKAGVSADLDALAAYVSSLGGIPRSPFRNADGTLTADATSGLEFFVELGCDTCHGGDDFTDSAEGELHDVGTLTELSGMRLGAELTGIDTPTLLGIWQTAPYLHDGSAPTLRDVLVARNPDGDHGDTAALSEAELDQLVAYLLQIDHGLPPEDLTLPPPPATGGSGGLGGAEGVGGAVSSGGEPPASPATGGSLVGSGSGGSGAGGTGEAADPGTGCGCKISGAPSASNRVWACCAWALIGLTLARRRSLVPRR